MIRARTSPRDLLDAARALHHLGLTRPAHLASAVRAVGLPFLRGHRSPALLVRLWARSAPDRPALIHPGGAFTFHALDLEVDALASGLEQAGLRRGDRVVTALRNRPEALLLPLALGRLGAVAVATSWQTTAPELRRVAATTGARRLFLDAECPAADAELPVPVTRVGPDPASLAPFRRPGAVRPRASGRAGLVLPTSGTTGTPKAALRRFGTGDVVQLLRFLEATPLTAGGVHLAVCPLFHATAVGFVSMAWLLGSTVVLPTSFEPTGFLDDVARYRVTDTAVVPTMLHRLLALGPDALRRRDRSSLRAVFCGGAPLSARLATAALDALGDVLYGFYGSTETGVVTLATPSDLRRRPTTVGRPLPGVTLRVLDPSGAEVPRGEIGELCVRDPSMIDTYLGDEDAARGSLRGGLFSVGDLARVDREGLVYLVGRSRDVIATGGVKVHAAEVEEALQAHPAVRGAAVVGVPDDEWGQRLVAFVEPEGEPPAPEELVRWCRGRLEGPKVPREVRVVAALPRTATGKVLKASLLPPG